ncbi:MAG: ABC transporter permease, partial [Rhodanobacter sp.]
MKLHPILAALRKHKAGTVLIALQIALTLAIVCNAIFIIGQRIERVNRPTGLDESNLFRIGQQWVSAPSADTAAGVEKLDAMQLEDLAALRHLPGVASVTPINSLPLGNSTWAGSVSPKPGEVAGDKTGTRTAYYFTDEEVLPTLGLKLVAGRAFNAGDVQHQGFRDNPPRPVVMITQALAEKLFPHESAVGKVIYSDGSSSPSTVVGVVARMQTPPAGGWGSTFAWYSTLVPSRLDSDSGMYAVRTKPGQLETVMRAVPSLLYKINPLRVLDDDSIKPFTEIRAQAYRADVGMAILMGVICLILIAVTAAGIVGLTSFWVGQRHRQIGVRRALGARKIDILHYFQIENLLIA